MPNRHITGVKFGGVTPILASFGTMTPRCVPRISKATPYPFPQHLKLPRSLERKSLKHVYSLPFLPWGRILMWGLHISFCLRTASCTFLDVQHSSVAFTKTKLGGSSMPCKENPKTLYRNRSPRKPYLRLEAPPWIPPNLVSQPFLSSIDHMQLSLQKP
jgi:hypothetical protein